MWYFKYNVSAHICLFGNLELLISVKGYYIMTPSNFKIISYESNYIAHYKINKEKCHRELQNI